MAKRKIAEQDYSALLNVNMTGSTMTVRQLRKYISMATKQFNKDLGRYKGATLTSANYILDNIGNYRGKLIQKTDRMSKEQLLTRASLLRGHFRIDADSVMIETDLTDKAREAYHTLKKRLGDDEDFTEDVYKELVKVFSGLGDSIMEKLDSWQVAAIYNEFRYFGKTESASILDLILQVYDEMIQSQDYRGLEQSEFTEILTDKVRERLTAKIK